MGSALPDAVLKITKNKPKIGPRLIRNRPLPRSQPTAKSLTINAVTEDLFPVSLEGRRDHLLPVK